jgi:hypothetical protein
MSITASVPRDDGVGSVAFSLVATLIDLLINKNIIDPHEAANLLTDAAAKLNPVPGYAGLPEAKALAEVESGER